MRILEKHITSIFYQRLHFPVGFERYSLFKSIIYGLGKTFRSLLTFRKLPPGQGQSFSGKAPILLIVSSENQRRILAHLTEKLGLKTHAILSNERFNIPAAECLSWDLLLRSSDKLSIRLGALWKARKLLTRSNAKLLWLDLERILRLRSSLETARDLVEQGQYRLVLMANDHSYLQRLFLHAAKEVEVPTAYIQHALVSRHFPKLEFEHAFLYGEESLAKYEVAKGTQVYTTGIYDPTIARFKKEAGIQYRVGIATNKLDDLNMVEALAKALIHRYKVSVLIRLHPNQSVEVNSFNSDRIELSQGSRDEYLRAIDYNVSANTSFHLDALLRGVPSFYSDLGGLLTDYYGFMQMGLVNRLNLDRTYEELCHHAVESELLRKYSSTASGDEVILKEIKKIIDGSSQGE